MTLREYPVQSAFCLLEATYQCSAIKKRIMLLYHAHNFHKVAGTLSPLRPCQKVEVSEPIVGEGLVGPTWGLNIIVPNILLGSSVTTNRLDFETFQSKQFRVRHHVETMSLTANESCSILKCSGIRTLVLLNIVMRYLSKEKIPF